MATKLQLQGDIPGVVKYTEQSLSDKQKVQARGNIGAADAEEVNYLKTHITPEMFGAIGDGVTDDSEALQKCLDSDEQIIIATKRYKITRPLRLTRSKVITGGATFYAPSSDTKYDMFGVADDFDEGRISYVEFSFINFESVRDNVNIYPPKGHTRADGCLCSNVTFISLRYVDTVIIKNAVFKNGEYSFTFDDCNDVTVDGFTSLYSSMTMYAQDTNKITIRNGYSELYDLLGHGDHHFYTCFGNDSVIIENVKMISGEKNGSYPAHTYASSEQISAYGATKTVRLSNCYIEYAKSIVSMVVSDSYTIENCIFKNVNTVEESRFYFSEIDGVKYEFNNTLFRSDRLIAISDDTGVGDLKFNNCNFEKTIALVTASALTTEFTNCRLINVDIKPACNIPATFRNCHLTHDGYPIYITSASEVLFVGCHIEANADGVISVRNNDGNVTMIGCYGDNAKSSKKFEYHGDYTPVIKVYNCIFPTLALRNAAHLVGSNNVFA